MYRINERRNSEMNIPTFQEAIMNLNSMCIPCMLTKQYQLIEHFTDEDKKSEYIHQVLKLLYDYAQTKSSPWLGDQLHKLFYEFWGESTDYTEIKHKFNQLVLSKEEEVERRIANSSDALKECIKYVCAGNYIDFGVTSNVSEEMFEELWQKAGDEEVPEEEYAHFCEDLANAKTLVYLTDNCGEVVFDKIFLRHIKEAYPHLEITTIVRGEDVVNDATMEDAEEVGLTDIVTCIGNGNAAAGTLLELMDEHSKKILLDADVVISKGMGNFESLYGENVNPYYLFLCKCNLFTKRFGLDLYSSVFMREERIQIAW